MFGFKKKKCIESNKEIGTRLMKLTNKPDEFKDSICPPPMDAQVALNELCRFLLGENWYTTMPMHKDQINTEIVYAIETTYKKSKTRRKTNKEYK